MSPDTNDGAFTDLLQTEKAFIGYCILICFCAFGFALTTYSISVDEEISSLLTTVHPGWLGADRWGMALLNAVLMPGPMIPFYPFILAILFNLLSFLLTLKIWDISQGMVKYLAAIYVLTLPSISFVYQFQLCSYGYYLGVLLAVVATHIYIYSQRKSARLWTLILLTFAVSIYQATIFVAPTVYFIYHLIAAHNHPEYLLNNLKDTYRKILIYVACFVLALTFHQVISYVIRNIENISTRYHTVDDFFSAQFLSTYDPIFVIKELLAFLVGHKLYIGWFNGFAIILSLAIIIYRIFSSNGALPIKLFKFGSLTAAIFSTFTLIIATGHIWPARALMAVPFLFAGIFVVAYRQVGSRLQYLMISSSCVALIFNIYLNTRLFYADYLTWKKDSLLVKSITARAENEYGEFLTDKKIPLVVLGKPKGESIPSHITFETFGQSLFSWDNVNHQRILPLFQLNQIFYFENPGKSNIVEAKIIAKEMDIWPGKNALLYKNGMMILKVGEE